MVKIIKTIIISILISTFICFDIFASYNSRNPYGMHWKAYGDGTFAWLPKEEPIDYTVKQGAWYQHEDGRWSFYMSTDGGYTFLPLKSCDAFINFNDNPLYNMYSFDEEGIMKGGELRNIEFPPPRTLYINIYASNISLKLQPGGICINEGAGMKSRAAGPVPRQ